MRPDTGFGGHSIDPQGSMLDLHQPAAAALRAALRLSRQLHSFLPLQLDVVGPFQPHQQPCRPQVARCHPHFFLPLQLKHIDSFMSHQELCRPQVSRCPVDSVLPLQLKHVGPFKSRALPCTGVMVDLQAMERALQAHPAVHAAACCRPAGSLTAVSELWPAC